MESKGTQAGAVTVAQLVQQQEREDAAARQALATPLPGPLRDAFRPDQNVRVGRWTVGPFRDCHYEWLAVLEHPLERIRTREFIAQATGKPTWVADDAAWERAKVECTKMLAAKKLRPDEVDWVGFWGDVEAAYTAAGGKKKELGAADVYLPRGPSMWQLAYVCTHEPKEVRRMFREGGVAAVKAAAEEEFSLCTMHELFGLFQAVNEQMDRYWTTTVGHEEAPLNKEGSAAADAPENPSPKSSAAKPTG